MTFEVEIAGRLRAVTVERAERAGLFRLTVDGETHLIDAVRTGEFGLSLLGTLDSVPFSAEVHVTPAQAPGEVLVSLAGRMMPVMVNGRRTGHVSEAGVHRHGEVQVAAPMPGRVVRVLVSVGDPVAARQAVVVVEAMKMENELRAPRAGAVKEITVAPGVSVEAGRVLVVIE